MISKRCRSGPLFTFQDGRPLTRQRFVVAVRSALVSAGVDAKQYAGHSFRIGAATTQGPRGLHDPDTRQVEEPRLLRVHSES